jgi:hypothetical protein
LTVQECISLLVDELECRYAATDTTVQSTVPEEMASLTVVDPCGPWGLMIAAMSGIGLPAQMVRKYCDHGWIHLLCHPLDLPQGTILTIEADLTQENQNPAIELKVRTRSGVLGRCWFMVDSVSARGT